MSDNAFSIAVVGAGMASAPHLAGLLDLQERVTVRHVVARSEDRARAFAHALPQARVTLDLDTALADPRVNAVLLLTPPNTHLELGARIAAADKHLLIEKPIDVTTARARELADTCERHGIVAATVLQHRTRDASRKLRQLLDARALGDIHSASVAVPWWRPQSYYDEPGRGTLARDGGGVLMTQAIHTLDLFLWLIGCPDEVFAYAITSRAHRMECEDTVAGVMRYGSGCVASLHASTAAYPGFDERIEISGANGSATLSGGRLVVHYMDGSVIEEGETASLGSGANPMAFSHHAHRAVMANFIDSATRGAEPVASLRSALTVHLLIDALIASSANRRPMPVKPGSPT
ncbi:Gfo/Idh/MocA family protein [Caballeronia novacaledonica]|uniref:Gfo/Idh/MocA family oxidoreductase n=1 Tax=Caballeronia novacaledonica TaxID=1544861 RepID=A0AA37IC86_9BURK|nr:Gfo/Idh/MocA family oxidoreductase [Caballeronia novacaledonica]GJH26569.1 Gfo/Idh/MocA family oxidoreductase [Caballeronia novacaledonica]